jgi:1,4-dihydroxy-2-naphthoate octaprenyltransferase
MEAVILDQRGLQRLEIAKIKSESTMSPKDLKDKLRPTFTLRLLFGVMIVVAVACAVKLEFWHSLFGLVCLASPLLYLIIQLFLSRIENPRY